MPGSKYRWTVKGGIKPRRRRTPPYWSELYPAGVRPGAEHDTPPEPAQEPQDEAGGQGAATPAPTPETTPSARTRPSWGGKYAALTAPTDEIG